QAHRSGVEPGEFVRLGRVLVPRRQHLDLRSGEDRVEPLHTTESHLRPHDPEGRALARDGARRVALQARAHEDMLVIAAEPHPAHLADDHAAVLHRRDADPQAAAVAEADRDLRAALLVALPDEPPGDHRRHERHEPREIEEPAPAQPRPGQFLAGHLRRSQMARGSKLAEASMVRTTTAVKAISPGPGRTVAICPSFTRATRIASRKTSSIAHGPTTSMKR